MASYIPIGKPMNKSEAEGLRQLRDCLPENYIVLGNFELQLPRRRNTLEFDVVVIGDHGVYAVEIKGWSGRIRGDLRRWELEWGRVENPFIFTETKAKALRDVLARKVKSWPRQLYCEAVVYLTGKKVSVRSEDPRNERLVQSGTLCDFFVERATRLGEESEIYIPDELKQEIVDALAPLTTPSSEVAAIPNYDVEGELTRSGMSYREFVGRHNLLRSRGKVRIKAYFLDPLLAPANRHAMITRVLRDMEALNVMEDNPYVAKAYELIRDTDDELVFYVVGEWVGPLTLGEYMDDAGQRETLSLERKWYYALHLLKAMEFMHARRIVHRNLHPGVIYMTCESSGDEVPLKVADFDHARVHKMESIGGDLQQIGTEGYIAPEMWLSDSHDHRADIFSAGAILYELFTGNALYEDANDILRHEEIWRQKRQFLPDEECGQIWDRLLAFDPESRVHDIREVTQFFEERWAQAKTVP